MTASLHHLFPASIRRLFLLLLFSPVAMALAQPATAKNNKKTTTDSKAPATTTTTSTSTGSGTTNTPATLNKAPIAKNMKDYAKTPQGLKRAQKYGKNFAGGASNGTASKDVKYPDGTALHLKMVKNPSFGDQPTEITAKVKSDKDKKPEQSKDPKGQTWNCTTDHVELTATSTTFLNNDYSSSASHIYPGACYTFDNFNNGSYLEQAGTRYPLTIVTDNTNIKGSPYRVVRDPNMATIRGAVDDLFGESTRNTATESLTYQIYETSNDADQSIKISGGISGYGASLSAGYSTGSQSTTLNLTIDAIKTLFAINTVPPDSGFYQDPKVENTPNLMVIGSVSYGVRVLANLSVTFNSQQEAADFKASYSGWGVSANVNFDQLSNSKSVSSTINCYVVGGPGNSTISFDKRNLKSEIEKILAGATYKNAMPVKYEFYDMAGEVVGSNSATDDFAVRNCTPGADNPRLESVYVNFSTGNDNKNQNDNYVMYLYPGGLNKTVAGADPASTNSLLTYLGDGAVFNYGSGYNSPEYPNNSQTTIQMYGVNKAATLDDFKNGGSLHLHLQPENTDTWDINAITVTLNFAGNVTAPKKISFGGITPLSNNNTELSLYFGPDYKQR
jgi:hypothetical protein